MSELGMDGWNQSSGCRSLQAFLTEADHGRLCGGGQREQSMEIGVRGRENTAAVDTGTLCRQARTPASREASVARLTDKTLSGLIAD